MLNSNESINCEASMLPHPWRRYFARMLDIEVYTLIWGVITGLVFHWHIERLSLIGIFNAFIPIIIMILLEPLLLSKWGMTIGKFIFGLVLRDLDGENITYKQGLSRTFLVFRKGLCYDIPLFNLIVLLTRYEDCKAHKILPWEEGFSYSIKDRKVRRIFAMIFIFILTISMQICVDLRTEMPIHTGALTPKEYYENCNDTIKLKGDDYDYGRHLNEEGEWVKNREQPEFSFLSEQPLPEPQLTIKKGIVTGVRIEIETDNDFRTFGFLNQKEVIAKCFFATHNKMNFFQFYKSGILDKIDSKFEDYTFTQDGIKVTNKVELKGYKLTDDWIESDGREKYIHMVFEMEKV